MKEPIEIEKDGLKLSIKFNHECIPFRYDKEHNVIIDIDIPTVMAYMVMFEKAIGKEVEIDYLTLRDVKHNLK